VKLTKKDIKLINRVQKGFPLSKNPFGQIAKELKFEKKWVVERLQKLKESGVISRFGTVAIRKKNCHSTLAALKVPPERVNDVAHLVSSYDEVTQNYLRGHEYNLWFVVQSKSEEKLKNALSDLRLHMDFPMLDLPMLESYHDDMVITL